MRIFPFKFFNCFSTAIVLNESRKLTLQGYFFLRSTTEKKLHHLTYRPLEPFLGSHPQWKKIMHLILTGKMAKNKKSPSVLTLNSIRLYNFQICFQYFIVLNSTIIPLSMVTNMEITIKTLTHFSWLPFRTDVT